ncbi:MAG: hypothetical protein HY691_11895 [Chloroflexi bacterium]|nr:hypothetical protein [Chloroflexota bacterium]
MVVRTWHARLDRHSFVSRRDQRWSARMFPGLLVLMALSLILPAVAAANGNRLGLAIGLALLAATAVLSHLPEEPEHPPRSGD